MAVSLEKVYQLGLSVSGSTFAPTHVTVENHVLFSCQIVTSNSSGFSCDLQMQVSNDLDGDWKVMTGSATTLSGNDVQFYDVTDSSAAYCRVYFSNIAGSCTVSLRWVMK